VKRALLIGSQTGGLNGVHADVERMSEMLGRRGFDVTQLTRAAASRDGILAGYQRLIADTAADDVACIYYSGHGGWVVNPEYEPDKPLPRVLQYLVPTDDEGAELRGVMSFELSALLARLTSKTRNVTVILDCCHSGQMSRAAREGLTPQKVALTPKNLARSLSAGRVRELLARCASAPRLDAESNPWAVRLVAAEAHSIAYERKDEHGSSTGVFTDALLSVLSEAQEQPMSWAALSLSVRERVMSQLCDQRPGAEGPSRRQIWELQEAADGRPLALFFQNGELRIRGGALLGVVPDAVYGIMPPLSPAYDPTRSLGEAVVTASLGSTSRVRIDAATAVPLPQAELLGFPLRVPFRKLAVRLGAELLSSELAPAIAGHTHLALAPVGAERAASVAREEGCLVVRNPLGQVLIRASEGERNAVLGQLECVARAEALRSLEPGLLDASLDVEFGRVVQGKAVPLHGGESLYVEDRQYISVQNTGFARVFVAVLGIDARHRVVLLSRSAPHGIRLLATEQPLLFGKATDGQLLGYALSWPDGLPKDEPRLESLIVIAADDEQDFSLLTTPAARARGGSQRSSLERHLDHIRGGGSARRGEQSRGSEYSLRRIDYELHPAPRQA
jgi:hypothetical protein